MRTRIASISLFLTSIAAAAAPGRFDILSYNAPDGWKVSMQGDHLQLGYAEGTPRYLVIGVFRSQPAGGDLAADFAREWREIVDGQFKTAGPPAPATIQTGDGIRTAAGAAPATWSGGSLVVSLLVLDGGTRVASIMVVTADADSFQANQDRLVAFLAGLRIARPRNAPAAAAPAPAPPAPPPPSSGGGKTITVADLAGNWTTGAASGTTSGYGSGVAVVAGNATYHIKRDGSYTYESSGYSTYGGSRTYSETGTFSIDSNGYIVITPKDKDPKRYRFIDWKETDEETILTILWWKDKDLMYAEHWARAKK